MDKQLEELTDGIVKRRNLDAPPLQLWQPPLSGDIAIRIARDGTWFHDGTEIRREAIVRLFASILRREDDGEYYLVTPTEKWRIEVDLHPLIVTDISVEEGGSGQQLTAVLNTGKRLLVSDKCTLFLEPAVGDVAGVRLPHGLSALCSRAAWYRLVELATAGEDGAMTLSSGAYQFSLHP